LEHHGVDERLRAWVFREATPGGYFWGPVQPILNEWAEGLGFHSPAQVTPEFGAWLAEAAVSCCAHPLVEADPVRAVIETARDEGAFQEFQYEELPDSPLPVPPEYDPNVIERPEYQAKIAQYMEEVEAWYARQGATRVPARDTKTLEAHLLWLAWGLVDGLTDEAVAERHRERGGLPIDGATVAALYRSNGVATLIGLQRKRKPTF